MTRFGRTDLPEEQRTALRKAIRCEIFTIGYTIVTITVVAFVVGNSQAMKTAWIEDMLSLIPQIAFLVALPFVRRPPPVSTHTGDTAPWAWGTSSRAWPCWRSARTSPSRPSPGSSPRSTRPSGRSSCSARRCGWDG